MRWLDEAVQDHPLKGPLGAGLCRYTHEEPEE